MGKEKATSLGCYWDKSRNSFMAKVDICGRIVSHQCKTKEEGLLWCKRQVRTWLAKYSGGW